MEKAEGSKEMSRKGFIIALVVIGAIIIGLCVLIANEWNRKTWDTEHPLTNANISWEQTFYKGAWGEGA